MEGFPLPLWVAVAISACAGSVTFVLLRPKRDNLGFAVATLAAGVMTGFVLTFGVCEYLNWTSSAQHMFVGYALGLLGITLSRAAISVVESQGVKIIVAAIRRVFGIKDDPPNDGSRGTP